MCRRGRGRRRARLATLDFAFARDASNGWTAYYSFDRATWFTVGTYTKALTVARMGFLGMYEAMGYTETELAQILPFAKYGIIAGAVFGVAFLIFLLATRKHFAPPETAPQAS